MRSNLCAFLAAAYWSVVGSPSLANNDIWKAAVSGTWSTGSNWLDGSTPGNSDEATFDRAGTYTVTFNGDPAAIQGLTLANPANVTFTSSTFVQPSTLRVASAMDVVLVKTGATLTLGTSGGIFQPDRPLHLIADGGRSIAVQDGATFNVDYGSQVNCGDVGVSGTLAITNASLVAGASGSDTHAFLYKSGSGMVDLNTLIAPLSGWELLDASDINDAGQITGQGLIGGQYHAYLLTLIPSIPGDFNNNGVVDAADYVVWRKTNGTQAGYNAWRTHFGQPTGSGSGSAGASLSQAAVPEPATLVLLMFATAGWGLQRRRAA